MADRGPWERVWNRAASGGVSSPRDGDSALAALLLAHGLVMNGGVLHAVECLDPTALRSACDGFRYFALAEVATLLEAAAAAEPSDENEENYNRAYWSVIPDDAVILKRFQRHFAQNRAEYAP
jgi:hypothetical protein